MLDGVMMDQLRKELPKGVDTVLISSVARIGLDELKDKLWKLLHRPVAQRPEFPEWSA